MFKKILATVVVAAVTALLFSTAVVGAPRTAAGVRHAADSPTPPSHPVKLISIHHSVGENWLADGNGNLGIGLRDNNYFVSDTNYGWGPDGIGSSTDIGNWWTWFRGPSSSTYISALYAESGQNCSYSRLGTDPGGENEIVMFKSCFPNSALTGSMSDPVPSIASNPLRGGSGPLTVANCRGIYIDLLNYFRTRPDKLFVVVTAPPQGSLPDGGAPDRAFNNWLVSDWLDGYPLNNVFVFDFYNVLTSNGGSADVNDLGQAGGDHHRWWNGAVQHKTDGGFNVLQYPTGDDHPSSAGNRKATGEFVPLLNVAYNRFKGGKPPLVNQTWYLAEGCTGSNEQGSFETWVLVQNPGDKPADIDMTFQTDTGEVQGPRESVPAHTRRSYRVNDYVTSFNVSTKVNSSGNVVCERAVYGNNRTWAHDSIGTTAPASTWYLAEGCTAANFETWVLVQNPGDAPADINMVFQTENGPVQGPRETIAPKSRKTYNAGEFVTSYNVSTMVTATSGKVVCERAVYGNNRTWAHDSIGTTAPASTWYLAEGCTAANFETWVLVQNPGDAPAEINMVFQTENGPVQGPRETIAPKSRKTYNAGEFVTSYNVSTMVTATSGKVVCERAVYGNNRTWAHDSIGTTAPASTWYLAEGCTAANFETWVLVQNPGDAPAEINMVFQTENGPVQGPRETIAPKSRKTYNAGEFVTSYNVSTMVTATSGKVVCERAVYGNNRTWAHDSIGYAP